MTDDARSSIALRAGFIAIPLACAALLIFFAWNLFPIPEEDACQFLPPAVNWAAGRGLINDFHPLTAWVDPTGHNRFLNYPPLFPLTVGMLMPHPSPRSAMVVVAGMNAVTVFLLAFVAFQLVRPSRSPRLTILAAEEGGSGEDRHRSCVGGRS